MSKKAGRGQDGRHRAQPAGEPDYLFLDASFSRIHPGSPAEPVLAAWGITTGGKPAFTDLAERGLAGPLLVISDGAPGLIAAIEQAYPKALRQRCLIHHARNVLAKEGLREQRDSLPHGSRPVAAVEPSAVMLAKRPPGSAPAVRAVAEALPFRDGAFGAAMAVLTIHHWRDRARA